MHGGRRALIVALVVSLTSVVGCTIDRSSRPESSATAGSATAVDLTPFLTQSVKWDPCPNSDDYLDEIPRIAECATVEVPVDYFGGTAGTIDIALIRIPAKGESKGSLLVNPGGPGASGFDTVAQGADGLRGNLPDYDIVGFDPRGVARSAGFDCGESDDVRLDNIEADFTPESAEEFDTVYKDSEAYEQACRSSYPNWGFMGTTSVARDVYVISKALGDEAINYYGISYGSEIGYELLRTYPDGINRMILESVVDPAVEEPLADQMAAFNTQLEDLLALCASPEFASCGKGRTTEQVRQAFIDAARNLEDGNYTTLTDNGQASESLVSYGLVLPLYMEMDAQLRGLYIDSIGSLINDQDARQFEFWGYLYNSYSYDEEKFFAADDIQQLVGCLDQSERADDINLAEDRTKEESLLAEIQQRAPLLAAIGFSDVYTADDRSYQTCSYSDLAYQDPAIPDPVAQAAEVTNVGGVPVLLLAVTGDTATPYAWAQTIAGKLGVPLVSQNTTGHGVYPDSDNQCTIDIVTAYLDTAALPAGPVTC